MSADNPRVRVDAVESTRLVVVSIMVPFEARTADIDQAFADARQQVREQLVKVGS